MVDMMSLTELGSVRSWDNSWPGLEVSKAMLKEVLSNMGAGPTDAEIDTLMHADGGHDALGVACRVGLVVRRDELLESCGVLFGHGASPG